MLADASRNRIVLSGTALCQTATGWHFVSEAALEKFVWENLQDLFGLTPLKRQHSSNGEICDILAVSQDRALSILELKNVEDRYLIQQLTRYYANLMVEQPFPTAIDYTQPVRLIGIAPTYHRHNLIDQEHSKLSIELLQFAVIQEQSDFYFRLQTPQQVLLSSYAIPYQALAPSALANVPEPPALLQTWLGGCTRAEQEIFLNVRGKILACHSRMKEVVEKKSIYYGLNKSKLCAEILFHQSSQKPILFLRLPTPGTYNNPVYRDDGGSNAIAFIQKPVVGRLRLWMDGQTITHLGHVAEGFGTMKLEAEWQQLPAEKRPRFMRNGLSSRAHVPLSVESYLRYPDAVKQFLGLLEDAEMRDVWEILTDLAIEHWWQRL